MLDGDGSGTYTDATVSIVNNGDGSAIYSNLGTGLTIVNDGQGTALVSSGQQGWTVQADPVPPAASAGRFLSVDAARPVESCGTLISLSDSVLFDFGSHQLRGDVQEVLTSLAEVLNGPILCLLALCLAGLWVCRRQVPGGAEERVYL